MVGQHPLRAAQAAVARQALGEALALLLAAWRDRPAAAIAAAIDAVAARAQIGLLPPAGPTEKARNARWNTLARAGDPVTRGVLIASLTETRRTADTLARIELLARWPDPRFASKLGDLVERPIYNAQLPRTTAFWKRVFVLLAKVGDPRLLPRARGFPAAWRANRKLTANERAVFPRRFARDCLPGLERAYGAGVPALAADDAAACEAIIRALDPAPRSARAVSESELLAAIHAEPADDAPRMVYADWLEERGDPRGEFIALQLANRTGRQSARERALLAASATRWLGSLATKVKKTGMRFERGFLAACAATANLDADPGWATVREVDGAVPASDRTPVASLRVLTNVDADGIATLGRRKRPLAIERLTWRLSSGMYNAYDRPDRFAPLDRLDLPALRWLELDGWIQGRIAAGDLSWMARSGLIGRLAALTFPCQLAQTQLCIAALHDTTTASVTLRGTHGADNSPGTSSAYSWSISLERDPAGELSRATLAPPRLGASRHPAAYGSEVVEAIANLPRAALTSARVVIPPASWDLAERHLRRRLEAAFAAQHRLSDLRFERRGAPRPG